MFENYFNNFGLSDLLTLVALMGGAYTYIRHERRLRDQESKIYDYTIKENEEKELAKKSANIKCSVIQIAKATRALRISNDGISRAEDILITIDDKTLNELILIDDLKYPLLNQHDMCDIMYQRLNMPSKSYITIRWTDELGDHNKDFVIAL